MACCYLGDTCKSFTRHVRHKHLDNSSNTQTPWLLKYSCSTQLTMKFFLLINVKMPTINGILTFMSKKNSILGLSEPKKSWLSWYFYTYEHLKFHAQLSWAWKGFITSGPDIPSGYYCKAPVTPSSVSTAMVRSCLILRSAVRSQKKPWYFTWKRACHGVLAATKALLRSSHGVLSRSYEVHTGDYLRSHDAFTALSRRSQCMHCAFTAFALRWRRVEDVRLHKRAKSSSVFCLFSKMKPCP